MAPCFLLLLLYLVEPFALFLCQLGLAEQFGPDPLPFLGAHLLLGDGHHLEDPLLDTVGVRKVLENHLACHTGGLQSDMTKAKEMGQYTGGDYRNVLKLGQGSLVASSGGQGNPLHVGGPFVGDYIIIVYPVVPIPK